ncbi:isoprenyl transferase [Pseudoclavibacter endophyticus]|uniref:Isoprenyl transferase n=1 Tax=Pseudoclavibacter endophyticus TaxID=1778590 RepID=A0A6H9WFK6_9MICO|nr:isoprenyl transferase [Pseudoclavibacter endophyticus]KAB1649682.1 isoprenyl transferase [Pseudoclavibacter endophyticus]
MTRKRRRKGLDLLYRLYLQRVRRELEGMTVPRHVAMIIDGNRRWAKLLGHADAAHGHRAGAAKMAEFLTWCDRAGIEVVTIYLLSQDNLRHRSNDELRELVPIIASLARTIGRNEQWRVQHVGSDDGLDDELLATLDAVEQQTADRTGMHVNLAVGYGGRNEIVEAVRSMLRAGAERGRSIAELAESVTVDEIAKYLYTGGQPDPDLVIRTSGEQRLSDFLLWQSAHSEFYFVEALGPDLREVDFWRALRDYAGRQRRFGH